MQIFLCSNPDPCQIQAMPKKEKTSFKNESFFFTSTEIILVCSSSIHILQLWESFSHSYFEKQQNFRLC